MMQLLYKYLLEIFRHSPFTAEYAKPLAALLVIFTLLAVVRIAHFITKIILLKIVHRVAKRTSSTWDDIMLEKKVFNGLAHLVPLFIIFNSVGFASPHIQQPLNELPADILKEVSADYYIGLASFLLKLSKIYFLFVIVYIISTLLNAGNGIYQTTEHSKNKPIKGYIQIIKILVIFLAAILLFAILLGKDPTVLIAGLGAMAAVLLLVFKDTILGLVASIQLSANDMLKIGDWIEMPNHRADGTVIDISLNTVKVQNGDKTITTIPTYTMVSESFTNWRGMEESGGRRIKRSVFIDVNTIRFCDQEMLKRFEKFELIRDYVIAKEEEINTFNEENNLHIYDTLSGRRQTNIGVFRKYLEKYLDNNPLINNDMTFLVRQLQSTDRGLPIEIYVFSKIKAIKDYERVQSDIFDHILAVISEFDLRIFQVPSGIDMHP